MQYFVFKLLLGCAECGVKFPLEGPMLEATCTACHSAIEVPAMRWKLVFGLYRDAASLGVTEGKTRGSALSSGEQELLIRWGPARPSCAACALPLPVEAVPVGGDGKLSCACGEVLETFPTPPWLREVVPTALQLFGAKRDGRPESAVAVAPTVAARPVLFGCPRCGAGLDIAPETPRILTCKYCESDLYLPDPLWHALHPVKKRAPFWVAFGD